MSKAQEAKRITKGEAKLLIAVTLFVIAVLGGAYWWIDLNTNPHIAVPTPVMPSPNAYDIYIKATTLSVDTEVISGVAWMTIFKDTWGAPDPRSPGRHYPTLVETEAALARNAPALATLRSGFAYPSQAPPARSLTAPFLEYRRFHQLSRLLVVDARAKAARGNYSGAMSSCLDSMRLGTDIPQGGALDAGLVGVGLQGRGRSYIRQLVDHLSAREAKAAAHRLEEIQARQTSFAEMLTEEKWWGVAGMQELFHQPGWRKQLASSPGAPDWRVQLRLMMMNKRQTMTNYVVYMNKLIAHARTPYAAHAPLPPTPKDPLILIFAPTIGKGGFTSCETYNNLLLVSLALRAYRAEHGAYPPSLSALSPGYLTAIPRDPFALKGPLQYKRTAKGYLLYSIGPDGKDDGGTPSNDGQALTTIMDESTGDIVAGINVI